MTRWPPIRTNPQAVAGKELSIAFFCTWVTWIGGGLIGFLLMLLVWAAQANDLPIPVRHLSGVTNILLYSPIISWVGLLPAMLLSIWAMRKGWAGWFTAISTGATVGSIALVAIARGDVNAFPTGIVVGSGFAAFFWLVARIRYPKAFVYP